MKLSLLLALFVIFPTSRVTCQDESFDLLFVGNSYTGFNNLQSLVRNLLLETAEAATTQAVTPGGKTFAGHLTDATTDGSRLNQLLKNDSFDYVIFQEQSQIGGFIVNAPSQFQGSLNAAVALDKLVQEAGSATSVFYMTWGRRTGDSANMGIFPDFVSMNAKILMGYETYVSATSTVDRPTLLAPVGLAFEKVHQRAIDEGSNPLEVGSDFYDLYSGDGSHPSLAGSYLAACVIYATVTGRDPREISFLPSDLDPDYGFRLRFAAYQATSSTEASNEVGATSNDEPTVPIESSTAMISILTAVIHGLGLARWL